MLGGVASAELVETERRLAQKHTIVGAGSSPCLVLAVGGRDRRKTEEWGAYTVDAAALRHGAGVEQEMTSGAYARFPPSKPTRYEDGWLPD